MTNTINYLLIQFRFKLMNIPNLASLSIIDLTNDILKIPNNFPTPRIVKKLQFLI